MVLNFFSSSGLFIFVTSSTLFLIILIYSRTKIQKIWALFNLSVSIWGLGVFFVGTSSSSLNALLWWKVGHIGVTFIAILFYHTVWLLLGLKGRKLLYFAYIQGIIFQIFLCTDLFIKSVEFKFASFYYAQPGILYHPFILIWLFYVFYGHYQLFKGYKSYKGIKRTQISYFLLGVAVGFIGGISNFLPVYDIAVYPYANFLIAIYTLIVSYAILKYRLLDIFIVITRFAIFALLYPFAIGIPLVVAYWQMNGFIEKFGIHWFLFFLVIFTSIFITVFFYVYISIMRHMEDKLKRKQKRLHQTILQVSKNMTLIKDLNKIIEVIINTITSEEINYCAVYLSDENGTGYYLVKQKPKIIESSSAIHIDNPLIKRLMSSKNLLIREELEIKCESKEIINEMKFLHSSIIVPIFIHNKLFGFLVIGDKFSRQQYSEEDIEIYSTISNQMALAIENVRFIDNERKQLELYQTARIYSLGNLASGMGHQINNRLQSIGLIIEAIMALNAGTLKESNHSYLKTALENIDQAKKIIESLKEHINPSSGKYELTSLNIVINESIDMVKLKKGNDIEKITLSSDFKEKNPMTIGNSSQLQEVFFNLLDNADDAIKEARIKLYKNKEYKPQIMINISLRKMIFFCITVEDNGIGISKDDIEKLFVPFHTTKATSKKGTSPGLYVIYRIIKAHGGDIQVESCYGQGTKFYIDLKRA